MMYFLKCYLAIIVIGTGLSSASTQTTLEFLFDNAETYNQDTYKDDIGSPYLFEPWIIGKIHDVTGEQFYPMILNYDVSQNAWKARYKDRVTLLDPYHYWYVKIWEKDNPHIFGENANDSMVFIRGFLPDNELQFAEILHNGQQMKLIASFTVSKRKIGNSFNGSIKKFSMWDHETHYFLRIKDDFHDIRLEKSEIIELFEGYPEAVDLLEKRNPQKLKDWAELFREIEKSIFAS